MFIGGDFTDSGTNLTLKAPFTYHSSMLSKLDTNAKHLWTVYLSKEPEISGRSLDYYGTLENVLVFKEETSTDVLLICIEIDPSNGGFVH